jgi:murein DD-endopeptidase MepM/ murein hydrolase activator NlpD
MTEQYKQDSVEMNRRARKSAAMIGLAISMGATSLLMPRQGDDAVAAEPKSAASNVQPSLTGSALTHVVQPGQTLSQIAQMHRVALNDLASANHIVVDSVLRVGQVLQVPDAPPTAASLRDASNTARDLLTDSAPDRLAMVESMTAADATKGWSGDVDSADLSASKSVSTPESTSGSVRANSSVTELDRDLTQVAAVPRVPAAATQPLNPPSEISGSLETVAEEVVAAADVAIAPQAAAPVAVSERTTLLEEAIAPDAPKLAVPMPASTAGHPALQAEPQAVQTEIPAEQQSSADRPAVVAALEPAAQPDLVAVELPTAPLAAAPATPPVIAQPVAPAAIPQVAATTAETRLPAAAVSAPAVIREPAEPTDLANVTPEADQVYRVQPGDTLVAIAERTGATVQDLAANNGLANPHQLQVDQVLQVPTGATHPNNQSGSVPEAPATVAALATPADDGGSFDAANELTDDRRIALDRGAANPRYNPYIEGLKAEIQAMRDRYQTTETAVTPTATSVAAESTTDVVTAEAAVGTVAAKSATAVAATATAPAQPENPEFAPQRFAATLQTEVAGLQQIYRNGAAARSLTATSPVPEATAESFAAQAVATAPTTQPAANPPQAVAAATLGNQQDRIQELIGSTVSPELPPLAAAREYLPGSNSFDGYIWPARGILTSGYGWRWGRMHRGIDIAAPTGTPIVAAAAGVVVTAGWNNGGYGNLVDIRHADGSLTRYAHNSRVLVRRGQQVRQGEVIAEMGSTGFSTGPHLHFEVHPSGRGAINPMAFLPQGGLQAAR